MDAVVHADLASFDVLTHDRLAADPVRNTIALTSLDRVRRLDGSEQQPTLITFHDHGTVVGSLIRTPPWPVQTADMPLEAVDLAVSVLREIDPDITAVTGPREKSEAFAKAWGEDFRVTLPSRLYRLETLAPPTVRGSSRMATEDDAELLGTWLDDFSQEAVPGAPETRPGAEIVRGSLRLGNGHAIWETNGTPAAWATGSVPHAGMTRIGPVYTPPEHRRHGFGAAATAAVCRWAGEAGAEHVVLTADLANPTSNSVYRGIGFRAVSEWSEFKW